MIFIKTARYVVVQIYDSEGATQTTQFLVIKDEVLNRTKEININGLIDKLTVELMDHYKVKLLNVASGKFDGCYSRHFKGLGRANGETVGFKLPAPEETERILHDVIPISEKIYIVSTYSNPEVSYTVDMNVGVCECHVGQTGSACKHQYILWASSLESSGNFLPYLDELERKEYAEIAIGST